MVIQVSRQNVFVLHGFPDVVSVSPGCLAKVLGANVIQTCI